MSSSLWSQYTLHLATLTRKGWVRQEVSPLYLKPEEDIMTTRTTMENVVKLANKEQRCMCCHARPIHHNELIKCGLRHEDEIWSWSIVSCDRAPCKVMCKQDVSEEFNLLYKEHPEYQLC